MLFPQLAPLTDGFPPTPQRPTLTGSTVKLIACNAPLLSQLLTFSGGVSAPEVSSALCTLNSTQFSELAAQLQDQVMPVSVCVGVCGCVCVCSC